MLNVTNWSKFVSELNLQRFTTTRNNYMRAFDTQKIEISTGTLIRQSACWMQ